MITYLFVQDRVWWNSESHDSSAFLPLHLFIYFFFYQAIYVHVHRSCPRPPKSEKERAATGREIQSLGTSSIRSNFFFINRQSVSAEKLVVVSNTVVLVSWKSCFTEIFAVRTARNTYIVQNE